MDALDTNNDGEANISDPSYLLNHFFFGGPGPPPPYPGCGADPPPADEVECDSYPGCG